MHLKTRRVHIAGITPSPNATWMKQVCRNLTDCEDGFLKGANHRIMNRDTSFIAMREFLEQNTYTEVVLLPPKSPNLNAYMERWFRSLKSECLHRMVFLGQRSLENAVREYVQHYHGERNHQGLGNEPIDPEKGAVPSLVRSSAENDSVACSRTTTVAMPEVTSQRLEHARSAMTVRAHRETPPISRSVVAISGRRTAEIANDFYF